MTLLLALLVMLVVAGAVLGMGISVYNRLVFLKNNIDRNWSNIDVLLKQRHDELPKLIEVCRQYMAYEKETLEKVIRARSAVFDASSAGNLPALGSAEAQLRRGLGGLFALAENYPELKANQSFVNLQNRITQLEGAISDRRELYNESVNLYSVRCEQFPDTLIARQFTFSPRSLLKFDGAETSDVNVRAMFS